MKSVQHTQIKVFIGVRKYTLTVILGVDKFLLDSPASFPPLYSFDLGEEKNFIWVSLDLYSGWVCMRVRVFKSLDALRFLNYHSNECET